MTTFQDFKHWFDGVVFAIGDRPTKEQWSLIKEKFLQVQVEKSITTNTEDLNHGR